MNWLYKHNIKEVVELYLSREKRDIHATCGFWGTTPQNTVLRCIGFLEDVAVLKFLIFIQLLHTIWIWGDGEGEGEGDFIIIIYSWCGASIMLMSRENRVTSSPLAPAAPEEGEKNSGGSDEVAVIFDGASGGRFLLAYHILEQQTKSQQNEDSVPKCRFTKIPHLRALHTSADEEGGISDCVMPASKHPAAVRRFCDFSMMWDLYVVHLFCHLSVLFLCLNVFCVIK